MKVVIQVIHGSKLSVDNALISQVGSGLLIIVGVHRDDTDEDVNFLAKKITSLRIFKDENGKLNKNIIDTNGDALVVSNFTLQGELASGTRPNFSKCASHEEANRLYLLLADKLHELGVKNVQKGMFAHHMHLDTLIDGPLTMVLDSKKC